MTNKGQPEKEGETRPLTFDEHMHEIQTRIRAPKNAFNQHGKFNYRTAEGILASAKACLPDGAYLSMTDRVEDVGGKLFLIARVTLHIGELSSSTEAYAMHPLEQKGMSPSQMTGAASSYARKYALCGLLAIDDSTEDPDQGKVTEKVSQEEADETPAQLRDRLIGYVKKVENASQFAKLEAWGAFKDSLSELFERDQPKALEVQKAIGAKRSAVMIDDNIPDFDKETGEVTQ